MADKIIIRGDTYVTRRWLYRISFLDDLGDPFDLAGCTVFTTYKEQATTPQDDPEDLQAAVRHKIVIGADGVATTENGLYLIGHAVEGTVEERLTSEETTAMPVNKSLLSDVQLIDVRGEVFTWFTDETLRAIEGITNRTA